MVADFTVTDTMFDEFGHVWANVEGEGSFAINKYTSLRLVDEGLVIELAHDKSRYLAPYVEHDHAPKALAKVIADIILMQNIANIKPVRHWL